MIIRTRKERAERFAVVADAANGNTRKRDAVIALLAPDQPEAPALPCLLEIGTRDLKRCIAGLRARIDEEHVVQSVRRHGGETLRQCKGWSVSKLKCGRKVEFDRRTRDCICNRFASVTRIYAPQACACIEHRAAAFVVVVHPLCAREHARRKLEGAVRREGKPESGEIVRIAHALLWTPALANLRQKAKGRGRQRSRVPDFNGR